MTTLRSGSATDVGRVRENNQDWVLDSMPLFAVADGMGGHVGGEVAARTAVEALQQAFEPDPSPSGLVGAVRQANLAVWERSRSDEGLRGMGTTLTAAALVRSDDGEHITLINVGDSRAYMLRDRALRQLTDDHSVVEEMVRSGDLSAEEAAFHPQRHILTRALGIEPDVEVDTMDVVPARGDRLLLCSDGLSNEVDDDEIASVLLRTDDPGQAARELVTRARAYGGNDNITVVVIDVLDADGSGGPGRARGAGAAEPAAGAASGTGGGAPATGGGAPGRESPSGDQAPCTKGRDSPPASAGAGEQRIGAGLGAISSPAGTRSAGETALATTALPVIDADAGAPPGAQVSYALEDTPSSTAPRPTHPPAQRSRRITLRVVVFVILLLAVLAGAAAVVGWFAERSYYVGLSGDHLVIYQGRPGGFLWFEPRVQQRTSVTTSDVLPSRIPDLRAGTEESSVSAAHAYITNLVNEARTTLGTSGASTTTTAPPLFGSQPGGTGAAPQSP